MRYLVFGLIGFVLFGGVFAVLHKDESSTVSTNQKQKLKLLALRC